MWCPAHQNTICDDQILDQKPIWFINSFLQICLLISQQGDDGWDHFIQFPGL